MDTNVSVLTGSMDQENRNINMRRFSEREDCRVLIVTDVAARGVDIRCLDVVINYCVPQDHKLFIHRAGRTARQGANGACWSILTTLELP